MSVEIKRLPAVLAMCGRSRASLYSDIQKGMFPRPVHLGARAVGWPSYEVDAVVAARIAGKTDLEVFDLVSQLMADRLTAQERLYV